MKITQILISFFVLISSAAHAEVNDKPWPSICGIAVGQFGNWKKAWIMPIENPDQYSSDAYFKAEIGKTKAFLKLTQPKNKDPYRGLYYEIQFTVEGETHVAKGPLSDIPYDHSWTFFQIDMEQGKNQQAMLYCSIHLPAAMYERPGL